MVDAIFGLIIFSLIGYIIYSNEQHAHEVSRLLDRIMAKNLPEFMATNPPPHRKSTEIEASDIANISDLPEEEWDKMIARQAGIESVKERAVKKLKAIVRK